MNLYKFESSKISWSAVNVGTTNYRIAGVNFRFNDDTYFESVLPIIKNLINSKSKLIIVDHTRKESYTAEVFKVIGMDIVNQEFNANPSKDSVVFEFLIREDASRITNQNLNNYWFYLQYE